MVASLGLNTGEPTTLVVDLNCAFASIEQQHDPTLRGRPLAIAAYATDAATIVSASREARDIGIKTGMRVFEAKAIFPGITVREPNPPRYRAVSDQLVDLPGIAEASARRLLRAGIHTPIEFLHASVDQLHAAGMQPAVADAWLRRLRGFEVGTFEGPARKSYSHSHVLARATTSQRELEELLMRLSEMVGRRLRASGRRGSVVSISVVYRPDMDRFSKQSTLTGPIATGEEIYRSALALMSFRDLPRPGGTLGDALSGLSDVDDGQLDLFAAPSRPRHERLETAMDAIRDRFGEDAVQRARLLGRARVVRDRIAFGNTGHPDDRKGSKP